MLRALTACEMLRERNFSRARAEGRPAIQGALFAVSPC